MSSDTVFIRAAEVAARLGVTPARVYQLVAAGQLPAVRRGRRTLIPREAFAAYVAQMSRQALDNLIPSTVQEHPHV